MAKSKSSAVVKPRNAPAPRPAEPVAAAASSAQDTGTEGKTELAQAPGKTGKGEDREVKKEKLIRDSFTLPESDYATIKQLKERCLSAGLEVKKSEIVRVALTTLATQSDKKLWSAVKALPRIKTGRPKKAR